MIGAVIAMIRCDTAWKEREIVRSCLNGAKIVWRNPVERAVIHSNNSVLHDPLPTTGAESVLNLPMTLKGSECALILLINRMSRMEISRPPFQSRHDVIGSAA